VFPAPEREFEAVPHRNYREACKVLFYITFDALVRSWSRLRIKHPHVSNAHSNKRPLSNSAHQEPQIQQSTLLSAKTYSLDRSLPSYPAYSIAIYHVPRFTTKSSLVTWFPSFISIFLSFLLIFLLFLLFTTKSRDNYLLGTPIVLFLLYILSPIPVAPLAIKLL